MYTKTSKSAHYLTRTGSYSTVPHRNGRVDVLPPDADDQEITYQEASEQLRSVERELATEELRARELNQILTESHDWNTYQKLESERTAIRSRIHGLIQRKRELTKTTRSAAEQTFSIAFVKVAKARLSEAAFSEIDREAYQQCKTLNPDQHWMFRVSDKPEQVSSINTTARRHKVDLRTVIKWLNRQETRLCKVQAHAEMTGRSLDESFHEDRASIRALIAVVTRLVQIDSGER